MIKKVISAIVNAIAILMVLVSIGILTFGAAGGNALEYVSQPDYIESNAFENQAHQTMADVFDYIRLTDIFEEDGKLNLNQIIAQADVNGQNVSYSLDYLISTGVPWATTSIRKTSFGRAAQRPSRRRWMS